MRTIVVIVTALLAMLLPTAGFATNAGPEVTVSATDAQDLLPRVVYNSNHDEYLAVWHQYRSTVGPGAANRVVMGQRLDRYGVPVNPAFQISPTTDDRDRAQPDVAYDPAGDRYIVVYIFDYHGDSTDLDVRGRFIDWNGVNPGLNEIGIGGSAAQEWNPRVEYATVSNKYLVTWWMEGTPASVRGAFGAFGAPPVSNFAIAEHASEQRIEPDLAYQILNDTFLVVYSNVFDVLGKLVAANGTLGSEFGIANWPDTEARPSIATCSEGQYMVAWQSLVSAGDTEIYARPVWWDGGMASGPLQVTNYSLYDSNPSVSCSGIYYLVAYESEYSDGTFGIFAREMRAGTFVMQPEVEVAPSYIGDIGDPLSNPVVAGGAANWMVVWEHDRQPGAAYQDIHGAGVWQLFGAGFEFGNLGEWSASGP